MFKTRTLQGLSSKTLRSFSQQWDKPTGYDTGIQIYNCVLRTNAPLVLRNEHIATWYTCGPTVYDSSHLGHASCYVKLDIIQRILRNHFNINLVTAMNITDIDDKIIRRSKEIGKPYKELVKFYETEFWDDLRRLNVAEPNIKIRVSENIPQIVKFIDKIFSNKSAYVGRDKSVYLDVSSLSNYGKLHNINLEHKEHDIKKSVVDFALWKAKKTKDEPSWPSPWGEGRPGWHIECSALASMIFGNEIDIHAGGLDLRFPHHENEEAQCCVFHNKPQWVNYWLHTGQLNTSGQIEKMSKSLGNTISIDEMLSTYSSDEFRMACLLSNYRNSMEYGGEMMNTARNTLKRFKEFNINVQAYLEGKKQGVYINTNEILEVLSQSKQQINEHLKTDFNTARCVGVLAELTSVINKSFNTSAKEHGTFSSSLDAVAAVRNFVNDCLRIFGFQMILPTQSSTDFNWTALLDDIIKTRCSIRETAMASKNKEMFKACDDLRDCLKRNGVELKDHSEGTIWNLNK